MRILISPSKTMDFLGLDPHENMANYPLEINLREHLISKDFDTLKSIYKSSDTVVEQAMVYNQHDEHYKAVQLFTGAVFFNLKYAEMDTASRDYIDSRVHVFTGMYGIIPANEGIKPYRLDLNNKIGQPFDPLKSYWKPYVNSYLNKEEELIVDLASNEYRQLIDKKSLKATYVKIDFKEFRNNKYVTVGTYAKMARGQFLAEMAKLNTTTLDKLKTLSVMGYRYNEDLSSKEHLLFTK